MSPDAPSPAGGDETNGTDTDETDTDGTDGTGPDGRNESEVVLTLPDELRSEFKTPFGPVFTDARELLSAAGDPIYAIGDVVTYHLIEADRVPEIAVLDGYTERTPVAKAVENGTNTGKFERSVGATNPAAALSVGTLNALASAIARGGTTAIDVDGEEDLVTVPAIVAAPAGASVVYGQPGEGMVLVSVADDTRARARGLLERMDGDHERVRELLEIGPSESSESSE